ncbi:50S ribosomal protein L21 [Bacteroidia bacterium]|nr:50S ribosomal protein L21 [Bacteroidia bacterium]
MLRFLKEKLFVIYWFYKISFTFAVLKKTMYAIVEIAGKQFKVEKDQKLYVHRLAEDEGKSVDFDNVMLVDNAGKVNVGTPGITGASVKAKVLQHLKGDKVIVFKKKRRKGYKVRNGHRQFLTQIQIESIKG